MSLIHRGLHIASKQLAYLLIIITVLVVIMGGAMYWLSTAVEQRQDEIAQWLGDKIGYQVTIAAAGMQWRGLMPQLHIEDLVLHGRDEQQNILDFSSLHFGIDIIASIKAREAVINKVSLAGLNISVIRQQDGQLRIKGFATTSVNKQDDIDWQHWINVLNKFNFSSISIAYTDQNLPELSGVYQLEDASIKHKNQQWHIKADIQLPENLGQQLHLDGQVEIAADNWQTSVWHGQLSTEQLRWSSDNNKIVWQDVELQKASANINLSASGQGKVIDTLSTQLKMKQVELVSVTELESTPVFINELSAVFDWHRDEGGWQLSADNFSLMINNSLWPDTEFKVAKSADNNWSISSDYINLTDITTLLSLSKHSAEIIHMQQPNGEIRQLSLLYSEDKGLSHLAFELSNGSVSPWNNIPGISGLSLDLSWVEGLANIEMNSQNLKLSAEHWLEETLSFDTLGGNIRFQQGKKGWSMQSQQLKLTNADLNLQLDGNIDYSSAANITSDLSLKLANINVANWKSYIPQAVLSDDFRGWADKAFVAGNIVDGEIKIQGDLADFPYQKPTDKGSFDLALNVSDMQLHYADDWPDIIGVKAVITGSGNDLIIKSQSGTIADIAFNNVNTTIDNLVLANTVLHLTADLDGTTDNAVNFIHLSPLKHRFSRPLKKLVATGNSQIGLKLTVPLTNVDAIKVEGDVDFQSSQLFYRDFPQAKLTAIRGSLAFDNQGVYAKNINAKLFNEPIRINVLPIQSDTIISLLGTISTEQINKLQANSIPSYISGKTAYQVDVIVSEKNLGNFQLEYDLSTDLAGIMIDLPAPFTKASSQKTSLNVSMKTVGEQLYYQAKYGDLLTVKATPQANHWRAGITLGTGNVTLPNNGIKIRGHLAELSLDDWLNWNADWPSSTDSGLADLVDDISMTIDSISGFDHQLTQLTYSLNKDAQGWQLKMRSEQTGQGEIYWPFDFTGPVPLNIQLEKLALTIPEKQKQQKMALWPAMILSIDSFSLDDIALGRLQARATTTDQSWLLESATLKSTSFTAHISSASWLQAVSGDSSSLTLNLKSNDMAKVLTTFGYQQIMEADSVELTADLNWQDNPLNLSRQNINSQFSFSVGKGKLNDIEPGAAGRIFGLMSFAALPRRLSLDFSDLFAKGYQFDSISGSFDVMMGQAITDDFTITGPAATIEISGLVDLVKELYDQKIRIRPNVSSLLPLAGAVSAGPIGLGVGTAIMLADKLVGSLFGKNIVNLISYSYDLTGPWHDPLLVISPITGNKQQIQNQPNISSNKLK